MNLDEMIKQNVDFLVTETTLLPTIAPETILTVLRARKTTGILTFELIEGGIRAVRVSERTKATEQERDRLRSILKMNGT